MAMAGLLVAVLLAGCSDGRHYAPLVESQPAPPATTTDILRFREGTILSTQAPTGMEPSHMAVASVDLEGETIWVFTWPTDTDRIAGTASIVVSVEGVVVNPQADTGDLCFWNLQVIVVDGDPQTDSGGGVSTCVEEPRIVPTGVRTLTIPFELVGKDYKAGFQGRVNLLHFGSEAPDAKVELLTGAIEQDSTIRFEGFAWPIGLVRVT
jgi:hypothetical protein